MTLSNNTINKTFSTPHPIRLKVGVAEGELEIELTETAETAVSIVGDTEAVDGAVVEQHEGEIRITVGEERHMPGLRGGSARVRVRCPARSDLAIRTSRATAAVRGTAADTRIESSSGSIEVDQVEGSAVLHASSGEIRVGRVTGDLSVKAASGDVRIGCVGGGIVAQLASGSLAVHEAHGSVVTNTASGNQRIGEVSNGEINLSAVSGDIDVGIRRDTTLRVDASTLSGKAHSMIELTDEPVSADSLSVEIKAKSVSGDITVRRAVDSPELQPAA
jgi:DUF4097 and DUF4098 domain-containing protein YvlB